MTRHMTMSHSVYERYKTLLLIIFLPLESLIIFIASVILLTKVTDKLHFRNLQIVDLGLELHEIESLLPIISMNSS